MVFRYCEGCGNIVFDDITTDHKIVNFMKNAPTGQRLKEYCPIWLMENGDKR